MGCALLDGRVRTGRSCRQEQPMERIAYSIGEVVDLTGIGRTRLYEVIAAGELRTKKLGRRTLILAADLSAWLNSLPDGDDVLAGVCG
jgi:excisionase family DNA binding protein